MKMRDSAAVVSLSVLVAGLAGCGTEQARSGASASIPSAGPVTVESCGREVVFATPPEKVLAIGSEAPALLVAAGAGDAVTHYAGSLEVPFDKDVKPVVEGAERVLDDSHDLSFETIIATGVDVAIGTDISAASDLNQLAGRLAEAGVQLLTVSGYCAGVDGGASSAGLSGFELLYRDITTYGTLFGTEDVAAQAVEGLQDRVKAVQEKVTGAKQAAVPLYVNAEGPLGAYGGQALVSEQMTLLGLDNVFQEVEKRYFEPSTEQIVSAAPDLVFATYVPKQASPLASDADVTKLLRARPELAGVKAVSDDQTLLPLNYFYTSPSPLAVDGLELLADQLDRG